MKCRDCGADSKVLETRAYLTVFLTRRRECFNEHRFTTVEVYIRLIDLARLTQFARGVDRRAAAEQRRRLVLSAPAHLSNSEIARRVGVGKGRVGNIKKEQQSAERATANDDACK